MNSKRIEWIDLLKGFAMLLIIISHIGAPNVYVRFYTPIFLPIFFWVAGYTWSPRRNFKEYLFRKVQSLVVPLVCLGTINAIIAIILEGDSWIDRFSGLFLQRSLIWDDLWFLACLFSAEIIFYGMYKISYFRSNNYKMIKLACFSFIVSYCGYAYISYNGASLPWQFENACVLSLFITQGYLYRYYFEQKLVNIEKWVLLLPISVAIYSMCVLIYNNDVNIHTEKYGIFLCFLLTAIIGNFMLVLIAKIIEYRFRSSSKSCLYRYMIFGGQNTLVLYAFQSKFIKLLKIVFSKITLNINGYIFSIVAAITVYALLIAPAWIIRKYMPIMIGKFEVYKGRESL